MKEYGRLLADDGEWASRADAFADRCVDFAQFVAAPENAEGWSEAVARARVRSEETLTYDDPCHLCHGQGVRDEPRALLDALPGMQRVELDRSENCCGSAGIYSVLRPNDSNAVLAEKLRALSESGAKTLVTANPGCQIQWEAGARREGMDVEVLHLAEVIDRVTRSLEGQ